MRALAKQRGIEDNVTFFRWVPYENKERLNSVAPVGIVTCLSPPSNTGCLSNELFDYMLLGVPMVASNSSLCREVAEPSQCGLLVHPSRPKEIVEAMTHLIERPDEARDGRMPAARRPGAI